MLEKRYTKWKFNLSRSQHTSLKLNFIWYNVSPTFLNINFGGMLTKLFAITILLFFSLTLSAQDKKDTTIKVDGKYITLSEIVCK